MAVRKRVPVSDVVWNAAVETATEMVKRLKGSADAIAVQLYREKVRKAECENATKCALAQYIANHMPPGVEVGVGSAVRLTSHKPFFRNHNIRLKTAATTFIDNFDQEQYGFLQ